MTIRVLLVDDVAEVRTLVRTTLRIRGGFDVVGEASDGSEAIRLTGSSQPDVVVLDLGLPDLTSRDVLTGIRKKSPASKVVVFSGTDPEDREWIEEHVEGYVVKDAQVGYLADLLESVGQGQGAEATLELDKTLASAASAREFVARKMVEWNLDTLLDDALLVASELAANAVLHAQSTCTLRLSLRQRTLRIEVSDAGRGTPEPQPLSFTEEHGRGLLLVAALSTAWGLEGSASQGKSVWAELAHHR